MGKNKAIRKMAASMTLGSLVFASSFAGIMPGRGLVLEANAAMPQNAGARGVKTAAETDGNSRVGAANDASRNSGSSYGLKEDVQDGVILHAWDWSFDNIRSQMKNIAEAGYSAVQTSPVQPYKQASDDGNETNETWWLFYQPIDFEVADEEGENLLGTEADFKAMCQEADKYGIKIIVDVVANHVAADRNGGSGYDESIADYLKNEEFYHDMSFPAIDYGSRYQIICNSMGSAPNTLPDLNTENEELQAYILDFLKECIDDGADGFRFDAAKHIGVPADGEEYTFFPNVVDAAKSYYVTKADRTAQRLYCYGEILDQPGGTTTASDYTDYVKVTDNGSSAAIRNGVVSHSASGAALTTYYKNVPAEDVVLWAESHDEYQNEGGATTNVSSDDINKTWAVIASRSDATALFYARTDGYRGGNIGEIGSYDWMSTEVAAVNDFHNFFDGTSEYLSSTDSFVMNERGSQGAVIVNVNGDEAEVSLQAHAILDGVYKDQITGNMFEVKDGTISGTIGETGIAVIYNPNEELNPGVSISDQGGIFYDETIDVTIGLTMADYGTYSIDGSDPVKYTEETVITLGEGVNYDTDIVLTLTAVRGNRQVSFNYTFSKTSWVDNIAYLQVPDGWGTEHLYTYIYSSSAGEYSGWPGEEMEYDEETGLYKLVLPKGFTDAGVIFSDGEGNQYPLYNEGFCEFEENGAYILDKTFVWRKYSSEVVSEYTVYFKNSGNWDSVYAYMWADSGDNNAEWPGVQMDVIDEDLKLYGITVQTDDGFSHIIFNNNNGTQTDNLDLPGYNALFTMGAEGGWSDYEGSESDSGKRVAYFMNTQDWASVYAYAWNSAGAGSNAGWPGEEMTVYDASNNIYRIEFDSDIDFDKIIFNNNDGTQTADLDFPEGTPLYTMSAADKWSEYTYSSSSDDPTTEDPTTEDPTTDEPTEDEEYTIVEEWGNRYCVDKDGNRVKGLVTVDGDLYYFGENEMMQFGLFLVDGRYSYFGEDGKAVKSQFMTPYYDSYYFDADGRAHVGWLELDGEKYYFDQNGTMLKGMQTIDGNTYLFDRNNGGKMVRGKMAHDWWGDHFFDDQGVMQTGFVTVDGNTYYFNSNGDMQYGWQEIDGNTYFFKEDGTMARGTTFVYWKNYEFGDDGVLLEEKAG